jgi:hypothetical protein
MTNMNELWSINSYMAVKLASVSDAYTEEQSSHKRTKDELVYTKGELEKLRKLHYSTPKKSWSCFSKCKSTSNTG